MYASTSETTVSAPSTVSSSLTSSHKEEYENDSLSISSCSLTPDSMAATDDSDDAASKSPPCLPIVDSVQKQYQTKILELLDDLNHLSTKVNESERLIQEARSNFDKVSKERVTVLSQIKRNCGEKKIDTSRQYYKAVNEIENLKQQCQNVSQKYEKFYKRCLSAKKNISNIESQIKDEFDQFKQEKLNSINLKFVDAKAKCDQYSQEHMNLVNKIKENHNKISEIEEKHKRCIKKAKPYFDEKEKYDIKLMTIKNEIDQHKKDLHEYKSKYSQTMKQLESISEEIHEKRTRASSYEREPGVGAEIGQEVTESLPSLNDLSHFEAAQTIPKERTVTDTTQISDIIDSINQQIPNSLSLSSSLTSTISSVTKTNSSSSGISFS